MSLRPSWFGSTLALLGHCLPAHAQAQQPEAQKPEPQKHPRVALVLSSGGARGLAHIGVLEALEELHVPVDLVVGSESGALVGGLYAAGLEPQQIEHALLSRNWVDALNDRTPRASLSYRAKQEDRQFLIDLPISLGSRGLIFPPGLLGGERLRLEIARLVMGALPERDFDNLPSAFRAVATDLQRGDVQVLDGGSLATAIEASFSTPVLYPPVRLDGRMLVSGAFGDPLPVDAAQEQGAAVVIAVDVFDREDTPARPDLSDIGLRVFGSQGEQRERAARLLLRTQDLLCVPVVSDIGSANFERAQGVVERGRTALLELREQLAPLRLDDAAWAEYQRARLGRRPKLPRLAGLSVDESCPLSIPMLRARIDSVEGQPLDPQTLGLDLARLYGLRIFQRVDLDLRPIDDEHSELHLRTEELPTSPLHWRVGMAGEFTAGGNINLVGGVGLRYAPTDGSGSEWRAQVEVGNRFRLLFEHRQALDDAGEWFVAPSVQWRRDPLAVDLGAAGSAQYSVEELDLHLDLVHEFAESWEIRAGPVWSSGSVTLDIGDPAAAPDSTFEGGGGQIQLSQDSLDDTAFPSAGWRLQTTWFVPARGKYPDQDETVQLRVDDARPVGDDSIVLGGEISTVTGTDGNVQSFFPLGGFLRLSGLHSDEISGPTAVLGRGVYLHPFGERGLVRRALSWYGGASLEAGNVFPSFGDVRAHELRLGGSVFVGVDTVFGPLYLGMGTTESAGTSVFVVLGRFF